MELAPIACGFFAKLHADNRTVEYLGRANHELDAACVRSLAPVSRGRVVLHLNSPSDLLHKSKEPANGNSETKPNGNALHSCKGNTRAKDLRKNQKQRLKKLSWTANEVANGQRRAAIEEDPQREEAEVGVESLTSLTQLPVFYFETQVLAIGGRRRVHRHGIRAWVEQEQVHHQQQIRRLQGWLPSGRDNQVADEEEQQEEHGAEEEEYEVEEEEAMEVDFDNRPLRHSETIQELRHRTSNQRIRSSHPRRSNSTATTSPTATNFRSDPKNPFGHRIRVGFCVGTSVPPEDLGKTSSSIAFVGKTGQVMANNRELIKCSRFGFRDVVGCGILMDSGSFFFTLNGQLVGLWNANGFLSEALHINGSSASGFAANTGFTSSVSQNRPRSISADQRGGYQLKRSKPKGSLAQISRPQQFRQVFAALSLHSKGECVRVHFERHQFLFDLNAFARHIQRERQLAVMKHAGPIHSPADTTPTSSAHQQQTEEEEVLDDLVHQYLFHYGYKNALQKFEEQLERENKAKQPSTPPDAASLLSFVQELRQLIYNFKSLQALSRLQAGASDVLTSNKRVAFHMFALCFVDILVGNSSCPSADSNQDSFESEMHSNEPSLRVDQAIHFARSSGMRKLLLDPALLQPTQELFALVALPTRELVTHHTLCSFAFREQVADEVALAIRQPSTRISALEQFLVKLQSLRDQSGAHFVSSFPALALTQQLPEQAAKMPPKQRIGGGFGRYNVNEGANSDVDEGNEDALVFEVSSSEDEDEDGDNDDDESSDGEEEPNVMIGASSPSAAEEEEEEDGNDTDN